MGVYGHHKRDCTESWLGEKSHFTQGNQTCISSMLLQHSTKWERSPPPVLSTSQMTRCKARPTTLLAHKNLFWQLSRDRNLHGLGMSHATYSSLSKTTFQGTLENGCHYGWLRKCWIDSVKEWASLTITGLLTMASQRKGLEDLCWITPPPFNLISQRTELYWFYFKFIGWALSASNDPIRMMCSCTTPDQASKTAVVWQAVYEIWGYFVLENY